MRVPAALILLLACPAFAAFRCPARGGAQWREYRSAHFVVDTNVRRERIEFLVQRLEQVHALVLQALVGEQVEIPGRLRVVVFADPTDFVELAPQNASAYYTRGPFGERAVVAPMDSLGEDAEVAAHEIAHHLSKFLFPVQPAWFSEGLAGWVQTVAARREAYVPTGSHLPAGVPRGNVAGAVPPNLALYFQAGSAAMKGKELLAWRGGGESGAHVGRGHAWSWLLYHWLWNERSKAFADYQKRLGDSGDPEGSWRGAFPEFDPGKVEAMTALEKELDRYRVGGRFSGLRVQTESDGRFTEGSITSSDLHLLLLAIRSNWPAEEAQRESLRLSIVEEAFAEDPGNPAVLFARSEKPDVAALRAAVRARPADYRGWLALGRVAPAEEQEAALRKAVEANPESAMSLNALAWLLATSGRTKEALPLANRALDLAPWNPAIMDTLAEIASLLGKCPEALQLERRAVATADSEGLRKRQAEIEQRCKTTR